MGAVTILKNGSQIILKNKKIFKGEKNADIKIQSPKLLKSINCPSKIK